MDFDYLEPSDVDEQVGRLGFYYRDRGLMVSALGAPLPVFGHEVYATLHEKGAALLMAVNRNHPMLDGNKRTSWYVTAAFYDLNGYALIVDDVEGDRFVKAVADETDEPTFDEVVAWLAAHCEA